MSILVEWGNPERTVIRFIYQGQWNWTEFHEVITEAAVMAESVPYVVDHIYDVTESTSLPSGALTQFRGLRNRPKVKTGRRVLVGPSMLIMVISQAMLKVYPGLQENFLVTATLAEAHEFLKSGTPGKSLTTS